MPKHSKNESSEKKPEFTTVKVSKDTLADLKEWQKTIRSPNLPDTIKLSLGYAKSFNGDFLVSQTELADRVTKMESQFQGIYVYLASVLGDILALKKQIQILEELEK